MLPLVDGDSKDQELCVDVVGALPRCMDMITADDVIRRVEMYYRGGALRPGGSFKIEGNNERQEEERRVCAAAG